MGLANASHFKFVPIGIALMEKIMFKRKEVPYSGYRSSKG